MRLRDGECAYDNRYCIYANTPRDEKIDSGLSDSVSRKPSGLRLLNCEGYAFALTSKPSSRPDTLSDRSLSIGRSHGRSASSERACPSYSRASLLRHKVRRIISVRREPNKYESPATEMARDETRGG